jgi:Family of unknown function (DUF5985)
MHGWASAAVFVLCFLTSAACAWLLVRSYARSKARILMWSAACFVLLAVNNFLVVIDLVVLPTEIDLTVLRNASSLAAVMTLLYGFIWELD